VAPATPTNAVSRPAAERVGVSKATTAPAPARAMTRQPAKNHVDTTTQASTASAWYTGNMIAFALVAFVAANDVDLVVGTDKHPGEKPTLTLKVKKDLKDATIDVKSESGHAHQTLGPKEGGGEL